MPNAHEFIRYIVVPNLVTAVGAQGARECRLIVSAHGKHVPCVSVEWAPDRHGCGFQQPALWARTNDADRFAGTQGPSLNIARPDFDDLCDDIAHFLTERLDGVENFEVTLLPSGWDGPSDLPTLRGDSRTGELQPVEPLPTD